MIEININSLYPTVDNVAVSHELNYGGSWKKEVAFYEDSTFFSIADYTVTASLVTNGYLIAEDISTEKTENSTVILDLSSTNQYKLIPGRMVVEFKFTDNNKVLCPAAVLIVNVRDSKAKNAQITPESYGTTAEILQEVAQARGTFQKLGLRLDDLQKRLKLQVITGQQTEDVFDNNTLVDVLYKAYVNNTVYFFMTLAQADPAAQSSSQYRISRNGIERRLLSSNVWTVSGDIPDGSITTTKLADNAVTAEKIDNGAVGTNQIASGAVKSSKIALEAINPNHLSADTLALFNSKLNWQGFTSGLMFSSKGAFDVYSFEVGKVYSIYLSANVLYTGSDGLSALLIMPTTSVRMLITYTKGIYYSSYSNDEWSEFKPQSIALAALTPEVQTILAHAETMWNTDYKTVVDLGTVSSSTAFDSATYCTELAEFLFVTQGSVTALFETSLPCKLTYNNGYQCVERLGSAVKFTRKINSIAPDFSADGWVKHSVGWANLDTAVQSRITDLESTVGTLNASLETMLDGGTELDGGAE